MIRLAFDFTSAQSYLALKPTLELVESLDTNIELLPYRVSSSETKKPSTPASVAERHQQIRNDYRRMDAERYARIQNVKLEGDPAVDSTDALIATLLLKGETRQQFVTRTFRDFWDGKLDVSDRDALQRVFDDYSSQPIDWNETADRSLTDLRNQLEEEGVFSVPTYLVQGELFQGRQHLPMIKWLLNDRKGTPPL